MGIPTRNIIVNMKRIIWTLALVVSAKRDAIAEVNRANITNVHTDTPGAH